ncbi:maspardin-like [Coccinella septempunctata]|uniref:maspardin-like n=1 Tax=Coccinella septempunctata TaxID=41139 RepID=UPI001D067AC2|nr:maspardin-like [Coccinella septempunctata]
MSFISELSQSKEYLSFRSSVPLKVIVVDNNDKKGWKVFDCGPKSIKCPLVCVPPVSGSADIYFKQALSLSAKGIRVISVEAPVYWNVRDWCEGFRKLLDHLGVEKVHIFGASLGGYLAQKFAEYAHLNQRVASLILCNTFNDTSIFNSHESAALYWLLPALVLKRLIIGNFKPNKVDCSIMEAAEFMAEKLESLSQIELASRLTLNCLKGYVEAHKLRDIPVTIIDVFDEYALSGAVREELYKCYPEAKIANMKSGGNFPYLSRCQEVNLYIQIHLRQFDDNDLSPSNMPLLNRC